MPKRYSTQDIALGCNLHFKTVDDILIKFNSALIRKVVQNEDYQQAILDVAAYLEVDPGELFLKLDEKLQTTIRSRAKNGV